MKSKTRPARPHVNGNGNGHYAPPVETVPASETPSGNFSEKECRRLHIIRQVIRKWLTPEEAGGLLDLSARQILRMVRRVHREGESGIVHRLKGRRSNHTYPAEFRERVLNIYRTKYSNLGPTAAHRSLSKAQKIRLNRETLRRWLVAAGLRYARA